MVAAIQEKMSNNYFISHTGNKKVFLRSLSENGCKKYVTSKSTQADILTTVISSPESNRSDIAQTKDNATNCYDELCCSLIDVKKQMKDIKLKLRTHKTDQNEMIRRRKEFIKVVEHIVDLNNISKTLESEIETTVIVESKQKILNEDFTSSHGKCNKSDGKETTAIPKDKNQISETIDILGDLFRLRVFPRSKQQSMPFCLENYFHKLSRGETPDASLSMSNEMLRLSSLSSFPRGINISMLRLTRAGFYCTGSSGETKCYSCGATYKDWRSNDDPMDIHRTISPSCDLVRQEAQGSPVEEENTSVSRNSDQGTPNNSDGGRQVLQRPNTSENGSYLYSHSYTANSATGFQNEVVTENRDIITTVAEHRGIDTESSLQNSQESRNEPETTVSGQCRNITATSSYQRGREPDSSLQNSQTSSNEEETLASGQCNHTGDYSYLGINVDKPKYPNYAPLQVRISSYQGWPTYLDQTPRDMAMAGFLYAGYTDYTRCFFCGGGLRNWEAGDDPWIEHARWFPKCAFVRQNKGERFVNAVQKKQQELKQAQANNGNGVSQQTNESTASIKRQGQQLQSVATESVIEDRPSQQLQSVAARSVLEMGYTNDQVLGALKKVQENNPDKSHISATDIMQVLLDESSIQGAGSHVVTHENNADKQKPEYQQESNDDTESLLEENRQLRDQRLCKVCLDLDATIAFLPCGHIACCKDCAPAMRKCPLCRTYIKGTVKTYLA